MASNKAKRTRGELALQVIIFSLGFFYAFVYYVRVSEPVDLQALSDQLFAYLTAMLTVAFGVGFFNLTRVHLNNVKLKRPVWKFSVILLAAMYGMTVLSMISSPFAVDPQGFAIPRALIAFIDPIWEFLYYKVLVSINATIFSLLAFYIASAAYRAFKLRTFESTLLLAAGILVLIGQTPIADLVWPGFGAIRDWILSYPNTAGQRGVYLGAALSILLFTARRMIRYSWGR